MSQTRKLKDKVQGITDVCPTCEQTLFCRMTEYTGNFPNKLQWQYQNGTAHYTKDGDCKGFLADQEPKPDVGQNDHIDHNVDRLGASRQAPIKPDDYLKEKQQQIREGQNAIELELSNAQKDLITSEIMLLLGIKKHIETEIKALNITCDPREIGMYTKLIYEKNFLQTFDKKA